MQASSPYPGWPVEPLGSGDAGRYASGLLCNPYVFF